MPIRDFFILAIGLGPLPFILKSTWFGLLLWVWHGIANPGYFAWGPAYKFPFSQLIAILVFVSLLLNREEKRFPWTAVTVLLTLFVSWMTITSVFALEPETAWARWFWLFKVMLMNYLIFWFMNSRERIHHLLWAIAIAMGFYAIKLGVFTILKGGQYMAGGPLGTLLGGNNHMAVGLVIFVPIAFYLYSQAKVKWLRMGMLATALLGVVGAFGSQSRGALLAIATMVVTLLWKKKRQRLPLLIVFAISIPAIWHFMPDSWHERMDTISEYEEDESAQGRLYAWTTAYNVASDRLTGGGFNPLSTEYALKYSPGEPKIIDTHSIYFQVMSHHGFPGFFLFLALGLAGYWTAARIQRVTRYSEDLAWAGELARMLQASLVGYAVGGAFVNLAYLDLYYYLLALLTATHVLVLKATQLFPGQLATTSEGVHPAPAITTGAFHR